MKVLCIQGYDEVLQEGEVYTVTDTTEAGNYILLETEPPQPYTSFKQERFVPLSGETYEELMELEKESY